MSKLKLIALQRVWDQRFETQGLTGTLPEESWTEWVNPLHVISVRPAPKQVDRSAQHSVVLVHVPPDSVGMTVVGEHQVIARLLAGHRAL